MRKPAHAGNGSQHEESQSLSQSIEADRRKSRREIVSDAFVRIGVRLFPVHDWASSSVLLTQCDVDTQAGDKMFTHCSIPISGERLEFDCDAYVLRTDREQRQVVLLMSGIGKIAQGKILVEPVPKPDPSQMSLPGTT